MLGKTMTAAAAAALCCATSQAAQVNITIENLDDAGGFSFTPFWLGVHDGGFDAFDAGAMANMDVTAIAEGGDTSVITGEFAMSYPGGVQTTFLEPNGPPVFSPGESATTSLMIADTMTNRYLNYLSMVVPSNDLFIGNDSAIELFDAGGNFNGPIVIDIYGSNVWDNGTEVNDITNGPAFVQGQDGSAGLGENETIQAFFDRPGADAYLDSIVGVVTAPGDVITNRFSEGDLIGRITITPTPGAFALLGLAGLAGRGRRRG
jgi:hypothetical protein